MRSRGRLRLLGVVVAFVAVLVAASTVPFDAEAAYQAELVQRQTSGVAGAASDLWLLARLNGMGPPSAQTGEVLFRVDRRQLDASAVDGLVSAPPGTRFGFATTDEPGNQQHDAMTKTGAVADPATGEPVVQADIAVPPDFVPALGPTLPVTLRATPTQVVITANLQEAARKLAGAIPGLRFNLVSMYLFGRYAGGRRLGRNPAMATSLRSSVTARPCADAACSALGPGVDDDVEIRLPNALTISAPRRATYGVPVRFHGRGTPGDRIELGYRLAPGVIYRQEDGSFGRFPLLAPIYPRVVARVSPLLPAIVTVRRDGRWSLAVALRTRFPSLSVPYPASGRYAAVAYRDRVSGAPGGFTGGQFSIFQDAAKPTVVSLTRPSIRLTRRAGRLRIAVAVRGGDEQVTVRLHFGKRLLATRRLGPTGRTTMLTEPPRGAGLMTATATVDGARPARSSTRLEGA